jgi:hypothetical protein
MATDDNEIQTQLGEGQIVNPVTYAIVDLSIPDVAISACGENKQMLSDLRDFDMVCRHAVVKMTSGDARTRRVRGQHLQAIVTMGSITPVQSILKEAWESYPQFRDEFLRISTISLKMREFKKLESMASTDPAFNQFKKMLVDAYEQGSEGSPRVDVEGSDI